MITDFALTEQLCELEFVLFFLILIKDNFFLLQCG